MENKYFAASNTFLLKEHVHVKNVRFAYISIDPVRQEPTTNLDFDVELGPDFYSHVRYYRVEFENDWPVAIYKITGEKLAEFNKDSNKNEFLQYNETMEFNKKFLKPVFYNGLINLCIAVQKWARETAKEIAKTYIVDHLEYGNED